MRPTALLVLATLLGAGEPLQRAGIAVSVTSEADAGGPVLVARFTPMTQDPPLHLYAIDLPAGGGGLATRLELEPGSAVRARGPLTADQEAQLLDGLRVYPEGAVVVLRLPISAPAGRDPLSVGVLVSYMACSRSSCLMPVQRARLAVEVPARKRLIQYS
ncbi:MAG: hypothetical protein J0M02_17505, partial [Planctomycetes bacterium]|nr:hypothetical protein [Planctomycetota bacterium]